MANQFVDNLVESLRALSPDLLEVGVSPSVGALVGSKSAGSIALLMRQVQRLSSLVPSLIRSLDERPSETEVIRSVRSPRGAVFSRSASSYQQDAGQLLPKEWLRAEFTTGLDCRPLCFLLHLLEVITSDVKAAHVRVEKYLVDALPARDVDSTFAKDEADSLRALRYEVTSALAKLGKLTFLVKARGNFRIHPNPSFPKPFPRSEKWRRLKLLASELLNPTGILRSHLRQLLSPPIHVVDVPYLYQRWCGLKVLETLEQMGWVVLTDRVPVLFLGGQVQLKKDYIPLTLWVEPRLMGEAEHPSALHSCGAYEATPDLVLISPGANGQDAFVLDPTISRTPEIHHDKGKYLSLVAFDGFQQLAGVPTKRFALRSWAIAPLNSDKCDLISGDGRRGTIPMHPVAFNSAPLHSWLLDVERHALAWG